jgi:hypothetical protein
MNDRDEWEESAHWNVQFAALDEESAEKIRDHVNATDLPIQGMVVDPHQWFLLNLDWDSVALLRVALRQSGEVLPELAGTEYADMDSKTALSLFDSLTGDLDDFLRYGRRRD